MRRPLHLLPLLSWFLATWFLVPFTFAAINASQTMVIQTGAAERARINTNGLETTRVSATYISTTLIQASGTPTAGNHLTTKAYVDTAIAAASGGRPKYMGVTGSSYNGALGGGSIVGVQKGNNLCNAAFAGSRMLFTSDIARTDFTTPVATTAWVHCDMVDVGGKCITYFNVSLGSGGVNCSSGVSVAAHWTETSAGRNGHSLTSTHSVDAAPCQTAIPIHCVKD